MKFKPAKGRISGNKAIILTIARLVEKKGIEYVIRAFDRIEKDFNVEYRIGGDGPLRNRYRKIIEENDIENVEFLGTLTRSEVKEELDKADIFILPSVTVLKETRKGHPP